MIDHDPDMEPLFEGADVTMGAFMLILSLFSTNNNIVGVGMENLLKIFALVLPKENKLCTTLHEYRSYFKKLKNPLIQHFYCSYCLGYLKDSSQHSCPNEFCGQPLNENQPYFLEIPLCGQIQNFFIQEKFYDNLQGRFQRKNQAKHIYEDIYDGHLYKSSFDNFGHLSSPKNISFIMNTDGAPVFKSSNVSIWPIYLAINELPYKLRMKTENMILAGLWFGSNKPAMSTFLKPLVNTFKTLEEGIQVSSPEMGHFISKAFLLCVTADLPARCILCNSVQFNGSYSCWKCLQKGVTAKVGKGHTHVYPYDRNDHKGPIRTVLSTHNDAAIAINNKLQNKKDFTEHGVKGFSWLSFFPHFDIVNGISIDYMHGVLLGVQKLLIRLWFSKQHSAEPFSIYQKICTADKRLTGIKPPTIITRPPRSIENDLKYWKASEYRAFLLYYGGPVLNGLLDNTRFNHYLLFVNAVNIFLTCGSTEEDIKRGEEMIMHFCKAFANLYDVCYMTLNVHQLIHLADSVRCLGPLYTNSCFPFEDKNGFVLKMIRGTQNIDSQIVTGISFIQKLPELKQRCIRKGSEVSEICSSIENPHAIKRGRMIKTGIYVLGAIHEKELSEEEYSALVSFCGHAIGNVTFSSFNRMEINESLVYGLNYKRMVKRNNSAIVYFNNNRTNYGLVKFFIEVDMEQPVVLAVTEQLHRIYENVTVKSHLLAVAETKTTQMVPVNNIINTCMYIKMPEMSYVCLFPNMLEGD